jgi:hypothetical protein
MYLHRAASSSQAWGWGIVGLVILGWIVWAGLYSWLGPLRVIPSLSRRRTIGSLRNSLRSGLSLHDVLRMKFKSRLLVLMDLVMRYEVVVVAVLLLIDIVMLLGMGVLLLITANISSVGFRIRYCLLRIYLQRRL